LLYHVDGGLALQDEEEITQYCTYIGTSPANLQTAGYGFEKQQTLIPSPVTPPIHCNALSHHDPYRFLEFAILQKLQNFWFLVALCIISAADSWSYGHSNRTHPDNYVLRQLIDRDVLVLQSQSLLQVRPQHIYVSLDASNLCLLEISPTLGQQIYG
jgi:hypothetical protein